MMIGLSHLRSRHFMNNGLVLLSSFLRNISVRSMQVDLMQAL